MKVPEVKRTHLCTFMLEGPKRLIPRLYSLISPTYHNTDFLTLLLVHLVLISDRKVQLGRRPNVVIPAD